MRCFDKQPGLFHQFQRPVQTRRTVAPLVGIKQVVGKFAFGKRVKEKLGVVKTASELVNNQRRVIGNVGVLLLDERLGRADHGAVGQVGGFIDPGLIAPAFQHHLRVKMQPFGGGNAKLGQADHLAGAFAHADVANGKLAGVGPVGVKRGVIAVSRHLGKGLERGLDGGPAIAVDKLAERFAALPLAQIQIQQVIDDLRHPLRRDRALRLAITAGVVGPFAAQN